ncbi:lipase family alpha/beta hydrolase [Paucibacter sp. DJ2R-2]|uniref:lipase family alpha/beta hydrolase n=1 Tax=Paucibacter sp. DJ2R-2 TaxID=2893558 RepID=UPI0021E42F96|nr:alpha/beta hydrolase [Paucibacter sp. DJ2R-2]MCV2421508.1 GPI inositol-deacylase [Paucibacter sp. DJ4R-1]MCV2438213.1 GPI inositol-deacylase [Paucibacter sp. DJ2R-2]
MSTSPRRKATHLLSASELRGLAQLATQGTLGVTDIVEGMHQAVWSRLGMQGRREEEKARSAGLTGLVYRSIRGGTRLLGQGVDQLLAAWPADASQPASEPSPQRLALLAALNGVMGDHLAESGNPLALPMTVLNPDAASAAPTGHLLLLIHGLCMNDLQWRSENKAGHAHDHGEILARALGASRLYLRYNSGRHISENGRDLAQLLQQTLDTWPVPVKRITIVGHSMGGLVARSAIQLAQADRLGWPKRLHSLVFLGSPHQGAPLERAGHWVDLLLGSNRHSAPLARLGQLRSAGITDLRHGLVQDADWQGRDRFAPGHVPHQPLPLPAGIACYTLAGTTAAKRSPMADRLLGDGLVPLRSALGEHEDPALRLDFAPEARNIQYRCGHLQLLSSPAVSQQLLAWLAPSPAKAE